MMAVLSFAKQDNLGGKKHSSRERMLRYMPKLSLETFLFFNDDLIEGSVKICTHKITKVHYALKTLEKLRIKDDGYDKLKEEIKIMQGLDHPHILRLHEVYENEDAIYLVLELCRGGIS
jgi:hypothetical protein